MKRNAISNLKNNTRYINAIVFWGGMLAIPAIFASNCVAANKYNFDPDLQGSSDIDLAQLISTAPNITPDALSLVKSFEGFRSYAYIDTSGLPVIGYGQSIVNGRRVYMGQYISRAQADAELERELYHIQRLVLSKVKVQLNPNQLGALTSLVYNSGVRILNSSTLIRKLNAGDYAGAANEFLRWNKANQGGRLVPLSGLTRRRQAERQLFLTPYY